MSERRINFILAPPLVLGGLFFILLPFGFATMMDGDPAAPMGWGEYLREVLRGGLGSLVLGILLMAFGLYLASSGVADRNDRTAKSTQTKCE